MKHKTKPGRLTQDRIDFVRTIYCVNRDITISEACDLAGEKYNTISKLSGDNGEAWAFDKHICQSLLKLDDNENSDRAKTFYKSIYPLLKALCKKIKSLCPEVA